jgi:excisionase family DNA binding protein
LVQGVPGSRHKAVKTTPAPLLGAREAAARLGVIPSTVYALCAEGKLPHVRVSNALRISGEDIEAFIRGVQKSNA